MTYVPSLTIDTLQSVYDRGAGITIAPATPIALTTGTPGDDALTVTDGTDTLLIEAGRLYITNATAFTQLTNAQLQVSDGTNTAVLTPTSLTLPQSIDTIPVLTFTGAATSGIGHDGTDVNIITGAVARVAIRDSIAVFNIDARGVTGTIAEPSWICGSAGPGIFNESGRLGISVEATTQVGFIGGLLDNATGDETAVAFTPTINKATSGDYCALLVNATETSAPGTDNRLLDLQVDGVSQAFIASDGHIHADPGTTSDPGFAFVGDEDTGFTAANANQLSAVLAGVEEFRFSVGSATSVLWFQNAGDAIQPNLTAWNDDTGLYFPGGSSVGISTNGTEGALFSLDGAAFTGTLDAATGDEVSYAFDTTVNKATSGNYTALQVNVTETAAPGTDDRLLDLQVGGATEAYITNGGHVLADSGAAGAASFGFVASTNTGMILNASDVVFVRGGATRFRISGSYVEASVGSGSAASPTWRLNSGDANTGFYHATDQVGLAAGGEAVIVDNDSATPSFRPDVDDTWTLGESGLRWADLFATTTTVGDLNLKGLHDDSHWTINESRDGIFITDRVTGKVYKMAMTEVDPAEAPPLHRREAA